MHHDRIAGDMLSMSLALLNAVDRLYSSLPKSRYGYGIYAS